MKVFPSSWLSRNFLQIALVFPRRGLGCGAHSAVGLVLPVSPGWAGDMLSGEEERVSESRGAPICAYPPPGETPKIPEEAGGAGRLHLHTASFVDPWTPEPLLWLPTPRCPAGLPSECPFSVLRQHPIPQCPQAAAVSCTEHSVENQDTHVPLITQVLPLSETL